MTNNCNGNCDECECGRPAFGEDVTDLSSIQTATTHATKWTHLDFIGDTLPSKKVKKQTCFYIAEGAASSVTLDIQKELLDNKVSPDDIIKLEVKEKDTGGYYVVLFYAYEVEQQ